VAYVLYGFQTDNISRGCDAERESETLSAARKEAKYMLSEQYRRVSGASERLAVVQIWSDDGSQLIDTFVG
jgi:hypothetical protein